jgi:tetratricopeptide (TPR) repeat protein
LWAKNDSSKNGRNLMMAAHVNFSPREKVCISKLSNTMDQRISRFVLSSDGETFLCSIRLWMQGRYSNSGSVVFISYAWEEEKGRNRKLQAFIDMLQLIMKMAGMDVFFDLYKMEGKLSETMKEHLLKSDVVITACTPYLFDRVRNKKTNVAFEFDMIVARDMDSVIPIIYCGDIVTAVPAEFRQCPHIYDLTDDRIFFRTMLHRSSSFMGLIPRLCSIDPADATACDMYNGYVDRYRLGLLRLLPLSQQTSPTELIIRDELASQLNISLEHHAQTVLMGEKGNGKSTLALQFSRDHDTLFALVRTVDACNDDTIRQDFLFVADVLGLDAVGLATAPAAELSHAVYECIPFSRDKPSCLFIFDGFHSIGTYQADTIPTELLSWLPRQHMQDRVKVIVTVTIPTTVSPVVSLTAQVVPLSILVDAFTPDQSEVFMCNQLTAFRLADNLNLEAIRDLCLQLHHNPLLLHDACLYMKDMCIDVPICAKLIREETLRRLVDSDIGDLESATGPTTSTAISALPSSWNGSRMSDCSIASQVGGELFLNRVHGALLSSTQSANSLTIGIVYIHADATSRTLQYQLSTIQKDLIASGFVLTLECVDSSVALSSQRLACMWDHAVILVVCTPAVFQHIDDNSQLMEFLMERVDNNPNSVLPVLLQGKFDDSVPGKLRALMVYDLTKAELYAKMMTDVRDPKGIIPVLIRHDDSGQIGAAYNQALFDFQVCQTTLLPPRRLDFVGRDDVMSVIHNKMLLVASDYFVLHGTGGVGKSTAASEYAYRHLTVPADATSSRQYCPDSYQFAFWIHAEDTIALGQSLCQLAATQNINTDQIDIKEWLPKLYGHLSKWKGLLIFDNATSIESIAEFLPCNACPEELIRKKKNLFVLITSRNESWANQLTIPVFSKQNCEDFIRNVFPTSHPDECVQLAEVVSCLPLAMRHAVCYMQHTGTSIGEYCNLYQDKGVVLFGDTAANTGDFATVMTTWAIALQRIEKHPFRAKELVIQCTFLDGSSMSLPFLMNLPCADGLSQHAFLSAVKVLRCYGLLESAGTNRLKMHQLLQEVVAFQQSDLDKDIYVANCATVVLSLADKLDGADSRRHPNAYREYIPQCHSLVDKYGKLVSHVIEPILASNGTFESSSLSQAEKENAVLYSDMVGDLGNFIHFLGDARGCRALLERALAIRCCVCHEVKDIAWSYLNLSNVIGELGDVEGQKEMLQRAISILEEQYGHNYYELATALHNMGVVEYALGNLSASKESYERAIELYVNKYGPDNVEVAKSLSGLGSILGDLGDINGKKQYLERALIIAENYYGHEHMDVAGILSNLADAKYDLGDVSEAVEMLEEALRIKEIAYGHDHYYVACTLFNLAMRCPDLSKRTLHLERALEITERHWGDATHKDLIPLLGKLSETLRDQNDKYRAKEVLERILGLLESHNDRDTLTEGIVLFNLGMIEGEFGNISKKIHLLKKSLTIEELHLGKDHVEVAKVLRKIGEATVDMGDWNASWDFLERALQIQEKHNGPDHVEVAIVLFPMGLLRGHQKRYHESLDILRRALLIFENHYGEDAINVANTLCALAVATGRLHDVIGVKELLERALMIKEKCLGSDHEDVATVLFDLGIAIGVLGDVEGKNNLLQRSLIIREHRFGTGHPLVLKTKDALDTTMRIIVINPSAVSELCSMGFSRQHVETALRMTQGNGNLALEYLLSTADSDTGRGGVTTPPAQAATSIHSEPAVCVAKPLPTEPSHEESKVNQSTHQPSEAGQHAIGATPVEPSSEQLRDLLHRMTSLSPDDLQRLVGRDGLRSEAAGSDQSDVRPGRTVVRLTRAEIEAIDRLVELGFDEQEALAAYLSCDRDEMAAANFLFDST